MSLPPEIVILWAHFAPLFSQPVAAHARVLLIGTVLATGPRTVTAALRIMGKSQESHFTNYHRVLNRAAWSARIASRILLGLIVRFLIPRDWPIVLGADDTVERRGGRKIKARGCYRDAVRSSRKMVVKCFGLKWVAMMVLVKPPWSRQVHALPVLTVLCWPEATSKRPTHKTAIDCVRQMVVQMRRWFPDREIVLVLDGGYAAVKLAHACRRQRVALICRLRLDAGLYDAPRRRSRASEVPSPRRGLVSSSSPSEPAARTRRGRNTNWSGTVASGSACGCSPRSGCGTRRARTRWRSGTSWSAIPKGSCPMRPTSAPTQGCFLSRSWSTWCDGGRWR